MPLRGARRAGPGPSRTSCARAAVSAAHRCRRRSSAWPSPVLAGTLCNLVLASSGDGTLSFLQVCSAATRLAWPAAGVRPLRTVVVGELVWFGLRMWPGPGRGRGFLFGRVAVGGGRWPCRPAVTFGDGRAEEVHRAAYLLGEDVRAALEAADGLGHPAVVAHPQPEGHPLGVVARRSGGHDVAAVVDHAGLVGRVERQVLGVPGV